MRFWLDMGVDGLRLDAIPYLVEREGTNNENLPETHEVLKQLRAALDAQLPERAAARRSEPVARGRARVLRRRRRVPHGVPLPADAAHVHGDRAGGPPSDRRDHAADAGHPGQLPVGDLPAQPRRAHARDGDRARSATTCTRCTPPTRAARINLGIRRRLAPLMENDRRTIELMNSLLLSLPGSPIIYYGDEIGMGDNIYLGDRNGVRTPMQWSPDRNAGFSRADPQRLYLPPIMDPIYGYEAVNVEAQPREPVLAAQLDEAPARGAQDASARSAAARSRSCGPATARSSPSCASTTTKRSCASPTSRARRSRSSSTSSRFKGRVPVELLGQHAVPADRRAAVPADAARPRLLLVPARDRRADVPRWHEERLAREELPVLVLFDGWTSFFRDRVVPWRIAMAEKARAQLEREVLPRYIAGAALVRGQRRSDATRAARRPRRVEAPTAATGCSRCSTSSAATASRRRTSCRSRSRGKTRDDERLQRARRRSRIAQVRQQAQRRRAGRRVRRRGVLPRDRRRRSARDGEARRPRAARCASRPRARSPSSPAPTSQRCRCARPARPEQQHHRHRSATGCS